MNNHITQAMRLKETGVINFTNGDYQLSIENFSEAIKLNPNLFEAFNNRALVKLKIGDKINALQDINIAINKNNKYGIAYYNRALILREFEKYNEAILDCNKALEYGVDKIKIFCLLGHIFLAINKLIDAKNYFIKAINFDNNSIDAKNSLGYVYFLEKDFVKALECFNWVIEKKNDNKALVWAYFYRAKIAINNNDIISAIEDLNDAKKITEIGKGSGVLALLGFCYMQKEDYEQSIDYYNRAINTDSDIADYYFELSICYKKQKKYNEAIKVLMDGKEKNQNNNYFNCYIGMIYYDNLKDIKNSFFYFSQVMTPDKYFEFSNKNEKPEYFTISIFYLNKIFEHFPKLKDKFSNGTISEILKEIDSL